MNNIIHLHVHTIGSLLDGYNKIDNLIEKVKSLGMNAVAITDHGNLDEAFTFHKKCHEANIKPILGIETYYTHDRHIINLDGDERKKLAIEDVEKEIRNKVIKINNLNEDDIDEDKLQELIKIYKKDNKIKADTIKKMSKDYLYDTTGYHLILLAKNQTGWNNLVKLVSRSCDEGLFNGYGHVDYELLEEYHEGIICTSACISSIICRNIREDNINMAKEHIKKLKSIFKDDFYLEIQPLDWEEQIKVNEALINLSHKLNVKLIATTDSHYTNKEDNIAHDVLVCIGTKKAYNDENRMKYKHEFWIKSYDEMLEGFQRQGLYQKYKVDIINALENTNEIASKVSNDIKLGSDTELLPEVDVPIGYTPESWLSYQCWTNLYKYLKKKDIYNKRLTYEARLNHELNVIITKGFASYILIVQDAITWGDKNGCPFGPGRGSGAGSLVLFLLGIVKGTDPVEYNLLFSRFLTMDRKLCPDIDSDIDKVNRQKLLQYLSNKYGHNNTCQVNAITKLKVKNGIKDVAKVFDIPFAEVNELTKRITNEVCDDTDLTFKRIDDLQEDDPPAYEKWLEIEKQYPKIIKYARLLEGTNRSEGIHAGGVLITPSPVSDVFPTRIAIDKDTGQRKVVTMWDKDIVEEAGGVKYDFLGLATVSIINLTLQFIKENYGIEITLDELYENESIRNDENVFDMLKAQKSEGIFQCESKLFKSLMKDIQPENINDLIAITSVARPGPLGAGMHTKLANRRNGSEEVIYPLGLEELLSDTYGTILYQEQVMKLSQIVAGFDDNQADTYLRKGLA